MTMLIARFSLFAISLLLGSALAAQQEVRPMPQPPPLPATAAENWLMKRYRLERQTSIYDNWAANRKKIAVLPRGSVVSGLGKLHVIYQPDVVTITAAVAKLGIDVGDTILRYTYEGEGFADFWIKGGWYQELDGSFITEAGDLGGCSKGCAGKVTQVGRKEEWLHVRLRDGRSGWFRSGLY
jgi:hypothetical protein